MASATPRPLRTTWPRWLAALLCCVLSVTAPFDLTLAAQVIEAENVAPRPGRQADEPEEPIDEEEDLLRSASPSGARRDERKQVRPHPATSPPPAYWHPDLLPDPSRTPRPAGCEHARRNGHGGPLLC